MKWETMGVTFARGDYRNLIFRYDNSKCWFSYAVLTTRQTAKSIAKSIGDYYGSKVCKMKSMYDDNDELTEDETNIICVLHMYDGSYKFWVEYEDGSKKYLTESEVFNLN